MVERAASRVAAAADHEQAPAGDLVVRSRSQVIKAQTDPFSEIGTTGLRQWGGFVLEEWMQQLSGRKAAWFYREMMDNDPIVGAILFAIKWLARGVPYTVKEGNKAEDAEFVESCMHDMSHTWGDFISEALSCLGYGWGFHELVMKRRLGAQKRGPALDVATSGMLADTQENDRSPASSKYTDGKIGWRKIPVRAQETLMRWHFDGYSGIAAMEQVDWHGGNHVIPIEKALLFRTQTTRQNPEGRSLLRNAVTSYVAVKNIKQIEGIGIERDLAGIPVATPPENVDLFSPGNAQLLARVQQLVTSLRRDEYEGVVLPTSGWKLELLSSGGSRQIDTDTIVRRYRQDTAASMLADFVLIGQDSVGSYAMVDVKSDLFGIALDAILDMLCEVFNRYAIPRLLALNGMDVSDPPQIQHASAGRISLEKVGAFLNAIALAGAPIPWSIELLKSLFTEAGLPANFEEHESPGKLPAAPPEPEPARPVQQRPSEPVTKAEVKRGAMVALYPSSDVAHALAVPGGEEESELHLTLAFLGDSADIADPEALKQAVSWWAADTPPLTGHVSGSGQFTGPEPVSYASADIPELPEHRQRLVRALDGSGFPPSRDHGFTPHITLAYGQEAHPVKQAHPLRFDHATLRLGGERYDFPLRGNEPVQKAERTKVDGGHVVEVGPHLQQRAQVLSAQLEREMSSALAELGEQAASSYLTIAHKASLPNIHRIAGKVLQALNIRQWLQTRLMPLLRNHAGRTLADTQRTIQTEIGLEVRIGDREAQRIAAGSGQHLGLRDIEPQVRAAILQAIRDGLAAGDNPVKTAQRIREMVPAGRFVNAGPQYRAKLIALDQTARLQRAATLVLYKSNPRITAVQLKDGIFGPPRSDSQCIARDGDRVPIDQADSVHPYHVRCTLSFLPVVAGSAG